MTARVRCFPGVLAAAAAIAVARPAPAAANQDFVGQAYFAAYLRRPPTTTERASYCAAPIER